MPANRLSNEITYQLKENKKFTETYVSIEMLNVMQQKNVPDNTNGIQDYKEPPAAYTLINLNASATLPFKKPISISVGVRNMLNTAYRDYLNTMRYFTDEMGINISIRLKIQI